MIFVKRIDIKYLAVQVQAGAHFAWLCLVTWVLLLPGCLVTNEIQFEAEEIVPPSVMAPNLGDMIVLNRNRTESLSLTVSILDPNVDEILYARWRLARNTTMPVPMLLSLCNADTNQDEAEILRTGTNLREHTLVINPFDVPLGCHRLELAISSNFKNTCTEVRSAPGVFASTLAANDVGTANWWILSIDGPPSDTAKLEAFRTCAFGNDVEP